MAKQVIKLGLEFDTKSAISSYRQLVSEMQKGGADPKAIKQFTAAIEKAETELAQLAAEGSTGFTDSKGIEQYQKKVLKTVTSMQQLALRMQDFSKEGKNFPLSEAGKLEQKIKDLKKAVTDLAEEAKKNLQASLKNMGFSKTQAAEIANAVKTEEELKQRLEQERQLRQKNLDLAREQAQASVDAARGTKASSVESNSTRVKALTSGVDKISGVNPEAIKETVAEAFRSGIRKGVNNANDIVADLKKTFAQQFGEGTEITNALSEMLDKGLEASGDNISGWLNSIALKTGEALNPEKFKDLVAALNQVSTAQTNVVAGQFGAKMKESAQAAQDAATAEGQLGTATENTNQALQQTVQNASGIVNNMEHAADSFIKTSDAEKQTMKSTEALEGGFNRLTDRLKYMFGFTAMFNKLRQVIRSTFNDIQALDKAYASIAYVTNETVADLWSTYSDYATMAEKLGQSTADVIKASAIYRQQGLDTAEALELTTDTMKLATIAGNDYSTATQEMTAALRGFKMEMDEGSHVSDVYSELAAHAAASVDDIAQAMSRTASIANSAGMSFENTSAFLTQMIETTQESAENIGTSMKTIIARFTELKENVAGTADSEFDDLNFNKVDQALKTVGVSLKDTKGQFRDLDQVFLELSQKWDGLDRNTQRYIATVAAGSRQQSRFIAMMDNYDRTIELINTVADSEGKADEQFAKAADTVDFKLNAIKTKWEEFKLSIMDSGFVKGLLDTVNSVMDRLKNVKMPQIAIFSTFAVLAAKNFVLNFINTLKTTAKNFQQIGKAIGEKIGKAIYKNSSKFKINLQLDILKTEEQKLKNKIIEVTEKNKQLNQIKFAVDIDTSKPAEAIRTLKAHFESEGMTSAEAFKAAIQHVNEVLGTEATSALEAGKALQNHNNELKQGETDAESYAAELEKNQQKQKQLTLQQQKNQAVGQALTQTFHALVASISAMAAGTMKSSEAAKTFGVSSVAAMGNIAASIVSTTIATQGLSAGFKALAVSVWSALWPILAVMAAVGAIAGIWYAIAKSSEKAKEAIDINRQLEQSTKKLNEAREKVTDSKNELKDLEDSKKSLKDLVNEYDNLHKKKIKTAEESERELELAGQIKEEYPEILNGQNSENGLIEISNNLLDDKLLKMDEEIKKQKELLLLQENEVANRQADVSYYSGMSKLKNMFGETFQMNKADPYAIDGELILNGTGNITKDNVSANADIAQNFADRIGFKDFDYFDEDSMEKIASAMDYALMSGDRNWNKGEWTDEQVKIIEEIKKEIEQIRIDNKQYDAKYKLAKEVVDENYKDKEEWERALIAGQQAMGRENQKSFEQMEQDNQITGSWKESANQIEKNFGVHRANGTINEKDVDDEYIKAITELRDSYYNIMNAATDGVNTADDYYTVLGKLKGQSKELFESWFPSEEDYKKFTAEGGMSDSDFTKEALQKYYDSLSEFLLKNELGVDKVDENLITAMSNVQKISREGGKASLKDTVEYVKALETEIDKFADNPEYQNTIRNMIPKGYELTNLEQMQKTLPAIFNNLPDNLSIDVASSLNEAWGKVADKIGGKEYLNSVLSMLQENKIPEEQWYEWLNLDFSKITNQEDFDKFKEEQIKKFREAGYDNAEEMFNAMQEYAKKNGILNISIETDADYDKFIDSLDAAQEKVESLGDAIVSVTKDIKTNGEVGYATFEKLKKSVEGLDGVDIYDYVNIDSNGKITANEKQLKELYEAQIKAKKEKIDQALEEEKLQLDALENQKKALEAQLNGLSIGTDIVLTYDDMNKSLIPQVENWAKIVDLMYQAENHGKKLDMSAYKPTQSASIHVDENNIEAIRKQYETQIAGIDAQIKLREKTITKLENDSKHIEQETQAQYREWTNNMAEAAAATDNLAKKQEDLAKAQQDVADKQKALNEAIEDYNKLLYGSENRQSGLDLLYNYKQAISAFSDEMTRAQELLEDSSSVEDSVTALTRYTNAAHQRLAYMQAEGTRYNAGLEARRSQLLSGATSYTNELTGNTTTINFGDYVKYNADTGLMAIDQKLIQDAKIADEWKDYIEKQVDDYNKLSQESLKNQDEIRKLEKEIQKRREDAIKKYADFEKDIAETLKAQYQEQVDNLKNKYDSMKEADDDYLDALQEAIEKQRKLRERENQWEDLAQKQKKLSLMQRDTSGANAIETQKLEKEVQKDREQLLDDSIDSAIENMQKLAEKQDELRQTEVELKEALLENTMYWNQQAEGVAAGFETAEDYVEWFKQTAVGLNAETGAQFENTMNEARNKFGSASEEIAWRIQSDMSQTGDAVTETITVTGEEIENITKTTSDTFVDEVSNTFERTKRSFNENMDSAIEKVHNAQTALQEAINKLNEASAAAKAASEEIARLEYQMQHQTPAPEEQGPGTMDLGGAGNNEAAKGITNYMNSLGTITEKIQYATQVRDTYGDSIRSMVDTGSGYDGEILRQILDHGQISVSASGNGGLYNYLVANESLLKPIAEKWDRGVSSNIGYVSAKFEKGGLVNYTGPAWVDGSPNRPEAFLSADDTERIGNAAKLLSDIPALNRSNISTNSSTYGDTNIEINLNIDHISSDVDIEEMLDRVKQEIVDIARPVGTNVILQQQV